MLNVEWEIVWIENLATTLDAILIAAVTWVLCVILHFENDFLCVRWLDSLNATSSNNQSIKTAKKRDKCTKIQLVKLTFYLHQRLRSLHLLLFVVRTVREYDMPLQIGSIQTRPDENHLTFSTVDSFQYA